MITIPLFISGAEIGFIIFILIMVFGADKIPDIARGLGKGMRTLRNASNDIKSEITKSAEKQGISKDVSADVKNEINKVKEDLDEITGSIKRRF
jgi:sec-independent protein translocase protein TatA